MAGVSKTCSKAGMSGPKDKIVIVDIAMMIVILNGFPIFLARLNGIFIILKYSVTLIYKHKYLSKEHLLQRGGSIDDVRSYSAGSGNISRAKL